MLKHTTGSNRIIPDLPLECCCSDTPEWHPWLWHTAPYRSSKTRSWKCPAAVPTTRHVVFLAGLVAAPVKSGPNGEGGKYQQCGGGRGAQFHSCRQWNLIAYWPEKSSITFHIFRLHSIDVRSHSPIISESSSCKRKEEFCAVTVTVHHL